MTREEIKNTPELVDFMLDKSIIADSREKLRKRLEEVCNLAIKALEQEPIYYPPCQDCHTKVNEIVRAYNNVKSLDDAISRQEAIHCVTETELYNETFAEAKMRIAELKPVLPKHESEEKK